MLTAEQITAEDTWIDEEAAALVEPTVNNDGRYIVRHPETGFPVTEDVAGHALVAKFDVWSAAYIQALRVLGKPVMGE